MAGFLNRVAGRVAALFAPLAFATVALCPVAPLTSAAHAQAGESVPAFRSQRDLDRFMERVTRLAPPPPTYPDYGPEPGAIVAPEEIGSIVDDASGGPSQESGVVKVRGDTLIVLHRGRLFTVSISESDLRAIDTADAFGPGSDGERTGGFEMLLHGDRILVIGYSFDRHAIEVNRFALTAEGGLDYLDTHYLHADERYSDTDSVFRLIGDTLVAYVPLRTWEAQNRYFPAVGRRGEDGNILFENLIEPDRLHAIAFVRDEARRVQIRNNHSHVHGLTLCNIADDAFDCSARAVFGGEAERQYVSDSAVYLWDNYDEAGYPSDEPPAYSHIYRLPFDGSAPTAISARGLPNDSLAFCEEEGERLNVLVHARFGSQGMWEPEAPRGTISLLQIPLADFGNGEGEARQSQYRHLDRVNHGELTYIHNGFVEDHLLYGWGWTPRAGEPENSLPHIVALPLDGGDSVTMQPDISVNALVPLGGDAAVIANPHEARSIAPVLLDGDTPRLTESLAVPAADHPGARSIDQLYRPDPGSLRASSGTIAYSAVRSARDAEGRYGPNAAAAIFLRRDGSDLSVAGELTAERTGAEDDGCRADCERWFGNARPLFIGNRIFALLGYELIEGRIENGTIEEIGRVSFLPMD